MEFFLASSDIVNIWESFLKKSTEKTPYDQMIWKNTWINHFSDGYKFEYLHNEDFFVPLKIKDSIASIIGDKDIVDYNNLLSVNQNFSKFEEILDQVFSLNIKIFQIFSISEKSSIINSPKSPICVSIPTASTCISFGIIKVGFVVSTTLTFCVCID